MIPAEPFESRLVAARDLTSFVRELVFERADGKPFQYEPGQWVNLVLPLPDGEIRRAYSIASAPVAGSPRFDLAVTRVENGPGSQYLHELQEGATLHTIGPHGLFTRDAVDAPSLFVATGTGVTPFRAMMQAAVMAGIEAPLWLLFGARHEEDVRYRDELEGWARSRPNVRYEVTLSQGGAAWGGKRGYVQAHVPALVEELRSATGGAEPHVYVCGLERMVAA